MSSITNSNITPLKKKRVTINSFVSAFQNVSVFVHHPDFDASVPTASTGYEANWVRFMSINDIRDQEDLDISYNYVYEVTTTHLKMAVYIKVGRYF